MPYDFYRFQNIFDPRKQMQPDVYGNMPPSPDLPGLGEASGMFPTPRINPTMSAPQAPQQDMQTMSEADQINALMRSLYTPEHEFSDRLKGMLDTMPQRPDHLSLARKIGSVIVGAGAGPEAQERATYAPYYRQLSDWQTRISPTIKGAELERANNVNERQLAYQTAQATTSARQQATREEAEKRRQAKSEADIARDVEKNRINNWKAENPDGEVIFSSDGFVHLVNPKTGHDIKTTVEHGKLTDLEKQQWQSRHIGEQTAGRIRVKQTPDARSGNPDDPRNWSIQTVYDEDGNPIGTASVNKITQQVKPVPPQAPGPAPDKPLLVKPGPNATQDAKSLDNRIKQYILRHPEDQELFEKDDTTGMLRPVAPSKFLGYPQGPSQEKYNQILGALGLGAGGVGRQGTPKITKSGTKYYEAD